MHRGYLGMLQAVYLAGMTAGERQAAIEHKLDIIIPADGMFYISAFQSGVERFICHPVHEGAEQLPFLESRLSSPKNDLESELWTKVSEAILANRLSTNEEDDGTLNITAFLTSLLGAMQHKAAMLSVMPLPDPAEISQVVAPRLAMPLIQLIAELNPIAESLPVPISKVDRSNVARFNELLESDTFTAYSHSQEMLTDARCDSGATLASIRKSSGTLIKSSKGLLTPKPALIHMLNIIPKIVDTIFGKLPGAIAQLAGNVAQDRLNDGQQVVIYQFDQWMRQSSSLRKNTSPT